MEEKKKVEVKKKTADDFAKAYEDLCEEYGFRIVTAPKWMERDDGTYSTVIQSSVQEVAPKQAVLNTAPKP